MKCPICEKDVKYEIEIAGEKAFCKCDCGTIIVLQLDIIETLNLSEWE